MKRLSYLFTILFCSILFASCGSINKNLKEEMQKIKEQCPIDMGQGIVMTNVDFYEGEKILEYVIIYRRSRIYRSRWSATNERSYR